LSIPRLRETCLYTTVYTDVGKCVNDSGYSSICSVFGITKGDKYVSPWGNGWLVGSYPNGPLKRPNAEKDWEIQRVIVYGLPKRLVAKGDAKYDNLHISHAATTFSGDFVAL
jgi:hypothetical protein